MVFLELVKYRKFNLCKTQFDTLKRKVTIKVGSISFIRQLSVSTIPTNTSENANIKSNFSHRISVAPMIDVSTQHFLQLLRFIAGETPQLYTEMYVDRAIIKSFETDTLYQRLGISKDHYVVKKNEAVKSYVEPSKQRENNVVQLGGSDPRLLAQATKILAPCLKYSAINLNLGCPSTSVQAGMFGAILMKDVSRVIDCIRAMEEANNNQIPITAKCRLGVDDFDSEEFIIKFIDEISSKTNVSHFIIHARKCLLKGLTPAKNRSIPPLNYERVLRLAQSFPHLEFTLNGGLQDLEQSEKYLESKITNLSGIMLGRKVRDDPMFLGKLVKRFINPKLEIQTPDAVFSQYIDYFIEQLGNGHRAGFLLLSLHNIFPSRAGKLFRANIQASSVSKYNTSIEFVPERDSLQVRKELEKLNPLL